MVAGNEAPSDLTLDEEALYNMPMEELEKMVNSRHLEQPDMDSTDDVEETEEPDEAEEEVDESEEEELDTAEDTDEEDQPTEESTEEEGDTPEPQNKPDVYKVKAVGTEVEFSLDELKELASKGLDYTKKMQEVAPWKKQIAAMKQHNVTQDDINMLIDLKQGNKEAILSLMKDNGIDPLDVDVDTISKFRPNDYSISDEKLALQDTVKRLSTDREVYARTENIVDNDWDSKSRAEMLKNPKMIEGLHYDIKNGVYDRVYPTMLKMKSLDGGSKSDLEYYLQAGQSMQAPVVESKEEQKRTQQDIKANSEKRKVASLPKSRAGSKKDIVNYLDDIPDEDYHKWLKKVESKY